MKIFFSWSGELSNEVANLLSDWLSCVIQASRPWISSRDLDRGALWFGEINDQLKDTMVGIICLTQENKNRPWILFEAGALAKGLSTTRVCTFLIDLDPKDIEDPLAQFNHTMPTRESMLSLVKTLNSALPNNGLNSQILAQVFETYWPQFQKKFEHIRTTTKPETPSEPRPEKEILSEILENTRSLNIRIRRLELENTKKSERENTVYQANISYSPDDNIFENSIVKLFKKGVPLKEIVERYKGLIDENQIKQTLTAHGFGEIMNF